MNYYLTTTFSSLVSIEEVPFSHLSALQMNRSGTRLRAFTFLERNRTPAAWRRSTIAAHSNVRVKKISSGYNTPDEPLRPKSHLFEGLLSLPETTQALSLPLLSLGLLEPQGTPTLAVIQSPGLGTTADEAHVVLRARGR